jgi:hypothetical protein
LDPRTPTFVEIYDGDTLIGYAPYSVETHNEPIPISPGPHTIRAKFNGMTKEEALTLDPGQTEVVVFSFERTNYADEIANALAKDVTQTMSLLDLHDCGCWDGWETAVVENDDFQGSFSARVEGCSANASVTVRGRAEVWGGSLRLDAQLVDVAWTPWDIGGYCYDIGLKVPTHYLPPGVVWKGLVVLPPTSDAWFVQIWNREYSTECSSVVLTDGSGWAGGHGAYLGVGCFSGTWYQALLPGTFHVTASAFGQDGELGSY